MPAGEESNPIPTATPPPAAERGPSLIDLLRLSRSWGFAAGDQELYRNIAKLTELTEGQSLLDVPCGRGAVPEFFARNYRVEAVGVDAGEEAIEDAEQRARDAGLSERLHFQAAPVDDLPYQNEVFDVAIGELGLASAADPTQTVAELARVTRPMGSVVLIGLIWTGHVDEEQRSKLVQHIGAPPLMLVEWKQALRDANVVELHVEDWSDQAFPSLVRGRSFTQLAELFTLVDKFSILRRAWKRWGWRGLKGAVSREHEIRQLLGPERTIGVSLIKGTKWHGAEESPPEGT